MKKKSTKKFSALPTRKKTKKILFHASNWKPIEIERKKKEKENDGPKVDALLIGRQ